MGKNESLYYKKLRCLFPNIGFSEGRFLRDIKLQLNEYSMTHPNASYEEICSFYGEPKDVLMDFISSREGEKLYEEAKRHKQRVIFLHVFLLLVAVMFISMGIYWYKSYQTFNEAVPSTQEIIVKEENK